MNRVFEVNEAGLLAADAAPRAIGRSPAFRNLLQLVERVGPTDKALLITGPTGAGKEVVAQLVHHRRCAGREPFVDVNCGAIPEHLMEAELFGHAKDAFTGAAAYRPGQLALAGKGTLFLDEVGELPMSLQPKLLRVLETRSFRPLGASEAQRFEGRILAATHRDLLARVREGTFREDLYYRLAVFVLEIPGLNDRREDIPALVEYFASLQPRFLTFTPEAMTRLRAHTWSGHVRQLRSLVDRLGVLAESTLITNEILDVFLPAVVVAPPETTALADNLLHLNGPDKLAAAEQLLIDRALQLSDGNKAAAARLLGVGRKVVERRLQAREDQCVVLQEIISEGRHLADYADFRAAIQVLEPGLALVRNVVRHADAQRFHFELLRLLGVCHRSIDGWLSTDALACYEAALTIGKDLGSEVDLDSLLFGIWSTQLMTLDLGKARATAQQMLQQAQHSGRADAQGDAHFAMANTLFWLGDSEEALACLARGDLLLTTERERIGMQGFDLTELAMTFEGLASFQVGAFQRARAAWESLVRRGGTDNKHAFNRVIALQGATWLACLFEDMDALGPLASQMETLSKEHGFAFYQGVGEVLRGCYLAHLGAYEAADQAMQEGYEIYMLRNGGRLFHSFQAWKRGEQLLCAGHPAESEALVSQAVDMALNHQERAYLSELLDVRARALLAQGDQEGAEQGLRSALSTAMALGSVPARIVAATHLAQFLANSDRHDQALNVLAQALCGVADEVAVLPALERATSFLKHLRGISAQRTN